MDVSINSNLDKDVILEAVDLTKQYDNGILAVKDLNLKLHKSEIFCMLGANGAGKTTTISLILNFTKPTNGKILIHGINVDKDPLSVKKHMAYVSENVRLYGNFTAMQNLEFFSKLGGKRDYTKEDYIMILNRVGLAEETHARRINTFSKGMLQKCGIAIAIAKDADILLLDEPTSGLDPKSAREFLQILAELKKERKCLFMTTHDIFRAKEISDRIGVMKQGILITEMKRDELNNIDLEKLYMKQVGSSFNDMVNY